MEISCRLIVLFWAGLSFVMFYFKVKNYEGEYATVMVQDTKKYDNDILPKGKGKTFVVNTNSANKTKAVLRKPVFLSGGFKHFYLFGAAITNSSNRNKWDQVRIYGQWHRSYPDKFHSKLRLCVKYTNSQIIDTLKINPGRKKQYTIQVFNYASQLSRNKQIYGVPTKVGLSFGPYRCNSPRIPYIEPILATKEPGKLGINTKICYGTITSESIIEWLEAMKALEVDTCVVYADESLNKDALKVLHYYERSGFVDLVPYYQPAKDISPRDPSTKTGQAFQDAKLLLQDAHERLRGYTYIGALDFDEFLIPSRNRTLKQLLKDLFNKRNGGKTAGFIFKSSYFFKSWGKVNATSDLELGQYLNTTDWNIKLDREKPIVMVDRINYFSTTHTIVTKQPFKMKQADSEDAYIRHYRNCRSTWTEKCEQSRRVTSYEMIEWANTHIADNVRNVRKQIFAT